MPISENISAIRNRIETAAQNAGRAGADVKLIAVSKMHTLDEVREACLAGQMVYGENRVQEAQSKFPDLRAAFPEIELHLIGPLQTNKAEDAIQLFDVIQTVDRPKLAMELARAIAKLGRAPRLYVEVNSGREPQKAGIAPDDVDEFLKLCRKTYQLSISGLMCIPPLGKDPENHFRHLKAMADRHALPHVSMGMSADFEKAIVCGASDVRIGTAIFGSR